MNTIAALNERFAIDDLLIFEQIHGMPTIRIRNDCAEARLALQGAHLIDYRPHGAQPLLWLSNSARFAPGIPLRGGIPICWPWFGTHPDESVLPAHGPARSAAWLPVESRSKGSERTEVVLELQPDQQTRPLCGRLNLRLHVSIGNTLKLILCTENRGEKSIVVTQAMHSYFRIGDIRQCRVEGLEGCDYLDKLTGFSRMQQRGEITFSGETDRIYLNAGQQQMIIDPALHRRITINSSGSRSCVIWNPWEQTARKMADFDNNGWQQMLCVETANAADDAICLAPGASHTLAAEYAIAAMS